MMLWYTSVKTVSATHYQMWLDLETWATPKLLQTYILVVDESANFIFLISQQLFQ